MQSRERNSDLLRLGSACIPDVDYYYYSILSLPPLVVVHTIYHACMIYLVHCNNLIRTGMHLETGVIKYNARKRNP
jgi:hypothetical protein